MAEDANGQVVGDGGGLVEFGFAVAALGGGEKLIERGAVKIFSVEPDGLDLRGVVHVGEGIGREQNEVGALSGSDCTELAGAAKKLRRTQRGGL